jgi:hypothetical protein
LEVDKETEHPALQVAARELSKNLLPTSRWKKAPRGNMTIGGVPKAGNDDKTSKPSISMNSVEHWSLRWQSRRQRSRRGTSGAVPFQRRPRQDAPPPLLSSPNQWILLLTRCGGR